MSDIFSTSYRQAAANTTADKDSQKKEAEEQKAQTPVAAAPAAKETKAQDSSAVKFREYQEAVRDYEAGLAKEKDLQDRYTAARTGQQEYENYWAQSMGRARISWESLQSGQAKEAQKKRDAATMSANFKKKARLEQVAQEKAQAQGREKSLREQQAAARAKKEELQTQLDAADSHRLAGYECNTVVQDVLLDAQQKGYLSPAQKKLSELPVAQFCEEWAPDADQFRNKEKKFLGTKLVNKLVNFEVDEKTYEDVSYTFFFYGMLILFVITVLDRLIDNAFFDFFGHFVTSFALGVDFYLVIAFIGMCASKKKDVVIKDSGWGVAGAVIAVFFAIVLRDPFYHLLTDGKNWFVMLVTAFIGSWFIYIIMNLGVVRKILSGTQLIIGMVYKKLFEEAGEELKKDKKDKVPSPNDVDAMIVCYLNHDMILDYFSQTEREELIESLKANIEKLEELDQKADEQRWDLQEQMEKIRGKEKEVGVQNALTDQQLRDQLAAIDRQYATPAAPVFTLRKNLQPSDRAELRRREERIGLRAEEMTDQGTALARYARIIDSMKEELQTVQAQIRQNQAVLTQWFAGEMLPPLENGDGTCNYQLGDPVLLFQPGKDKERPCLLHFNGQPVNLVYKKEGKNIEDKLAVLVAELWKAFTKSSPKELLRLALVDDCEITKYSMGEVYDVPDFEKTYQTGFTLPDQGRGSIGLEGLFEAGDIRKYNEELEEKTDKFPEYARRNSDNVSRAAGQNQFIKVNYCISDPKENSVPSVWPYHIAIFVVPGTEEEGVNYNTCGEEMHTMLNLIRRSKTWENGFVPVMLVAEGDVHRKWQAFVDKTAETGVTYHVDLETMQIAKA